MNDTEQSPQQGSKLQKIKLLSVSVFGKTKVFFSKIINDVTKHHIIIAIFIGTVSTVIGGIILNKIRCSTKELPKMCWEMKYDELIFTFKESTIGDSNFDKWIGFHLLADCFSDPIQLSIFLKQNAQENKDIKYYIECLKSTKNINSQWNAIALFLEAYWDNIVNSNIAIESQNKGGEILLCIKLPMKEIKTAIFDKLKKEFLIFPQLKAWVDISDIKANYDPIFLGADSLKFFNYVKNGIEKDFSKYFKNSEPFLNDNAKYRILPRVKGLKTETCIVPQLSLELYETNKLLSTYILPIPITRDVTSQKAIYIQNTFRAFIGTLSRKKEFFNKHIY